MMVRRPWKVKSERPTIHRQPVRTCTCKIPRVLPKGDLLPVSPQTPRGYKTAIKMVSHHRANKTAIKMVSRFSLRHRDHRKRYSIVTPTGHACTEDSSRAGGTGMKIRCPPFYLQGRLTAVPEANPINGTWYRYTAKCVAASDSQTRREQHPRSDFVIPQTVSTRRAVQTDHKSDQNPP